MEDMKERQDAEIEVLQSIFDTDFETTESETVWKAVNAVREFRICIKPMEEALKGVVGIRIHFKLPLKYPKVPPTMILEAPIGLNKSHVDSLQAALTRAAASLVGDEMIYELCSQAAGFITDKHLATDMERGKQTSLGDQRKKRGEEEEKATSLLKKEESRKLQLAQSAEATRLSLLISEEVRRKEDLIASHRKGRRDSEVSESGGDIQLDANGGVEQVQMRINMRGEKDSTMLAKVKLGKAISQDWLNRILPVEISLEPDPPFYGTAHVFDIFAPFFTTSQGKRKLHKVTIALDHLLILRHPNIQAIYGSYLYRYTPPPNNFSSPTTLQPRRKFNEGHTLIIVTAPPLLSQQTLESLLLASGELRTDKALQYFTQLVAGVEYLHGANCVVRKLRCGGVLIGNAVGGEKGEMEVRLGEVVWRQMLVDLNKAENWVPNMDEEREDGWTCPEAVEAPFVYDRARDMWDLGVILAQMLFGLGITQQFASPAELLKGIGSTTSIAIRRLLGDLLTEKKSRLTAARISAHLLESSSSGATTLYLSSTPKHTLSFPQIARAPSAAAPMMSPTILSKSFDSTGPVGFFWQPKASGSRYRSEFEELEFLGRGGGGQVVKARNRLDGSLYAIKKVRLPNDKASEQKILREVTIWSRMNHPNIVRYHTSWVETDEQSRYHYGDEDSSTQQTDTETETETETEDSISSDPSDFDEDEQSLPGADLDIDLGLDDLNDVDFLSHGHSKSISYPSIHFGNEDDDSRPASTVANSPANMSKRASRAASPAALAKQVRTLYIQMEYVGGMDLKEAIENGVTEVDVWRQMFQILSAMLHFTSLNIIHRDLKPSNIFIDEKGDVRIGDFGLAVNQGVADPADLMLSIDMTDEVDLTSGVGTSLYIAPESLSRGKINRSIKYSNKIDMYSLGIVFFELCNPFKTGMERIQVLRELRKPEIVFPAAWDAVKLARHKKIVQACLAHDAEARASPKDLLGSDLLPPRVGDDSIEETIRLLSHSGTTHAQTLITALFNQTDEDRLRKDFSYDFYDGEGAKVDNDPYVEIVRDKLSRIFRQKGAVSMDSPLLMPHSQIYSSRNPVRLLDADGTIACLPFQLNIPFCRMVARDTSLTRLKRWTIAPVYRASAAGGQPRAVLNAAFDIVSDSVTPASEAECLYVVEEILAAFPFPGETIHFLNHSKLLDAVVAKVPPRRRTEVMEVIVQHGRMQRSWSKTATELIKIPGVSKSMIEEMGSFNLTGNIAEIRQKILALAPHLNEALNELGNIVNLSHQLGVKTMKIQPLLATNWDFHRDGVLFETHHVKGKTREAIATGGRFDEVVSRLAAPEVRYSGRCPHVVGFSMSVPKLSHAAAEANQTIGKALLSRKDESTRSYGAWAVRRCDVYVVSFAPRLVEVRLDIVKELWKHGMKADLMYDDNLLTLTPEQLVSACRREGILWLVIVKPGPERRSLDDSERVLKVKGVLRGYEEEVTRSELVVYLAKEMREQLLIDEAVNGTTTDLIPESAIGAGTSEWIKPRQEYFPMLLDDGLRQKGKHKQRELFITKAQLSVEKVTASAAEAPVFAIVVDAPTFRRMASAASWVNDDEAFRVLVQASEAAHRDYLLSVRQTIVKHKNANPSLTAFWLFSLRHDKSSLLTFDT